MRPQTTARVKKEVGRRVAMLRAARGWTQEQLAERLDVSVKYLQRVEAGRENLTLASLVTLARHLRVRVDRLLVSRGGAA